MPEASVAAASCAMGNFLDSPITTKETEVGEDPTKAMSYGLSAMQGWRAQMEDDHVQQLRLTDVRCEPPCRRAQQHAAPLAPASPHPPATACSHGLRAACPAARRPPPRAALADGGGHDTRPATMQSPR